MSGGTWIDHFPGNFMWSNAILVCKGMAPYGAVAVGEIDGICERLAARGMGDPDAWWQEWCSMAEKNEELADAAAVDGRDFTASDHYLRAGNYYYTGERFVPPGERKLAIYRKALRCYREGLKRRNKNIEFAEVPYEGKTLPAYFMKAQGSKSRAPTVVLFDGMDNCKEMSVLFAGLEFARRGMNTLAIDGPGQGEALRLRKIYARHDYEVPGKAAYEFVAKRADVDPEKVIVMGYSFGGYYAPRIAAFERRQWILGLDDSDAALERAKQFSLAGVADRITCPVLVTHGANDRVVPVDAAHKLYAALVTKRKTLKIFTAEEGGAEHCQVDDRPLGISYIADWIAGNIS